MYNNWNKKVAKRFLLGALLLFVGAFALSTAIIFGITSRGATTLDINTTQKLGIAFLCAVAPVFSFTGFCVEFIRINKLSKNQMLLIVVFCIPFVIFTLIFGGIMLIPTIAKCLQIFIKNT